MTYGWMLLVVAIVGGAIFSIAQSESLESVSGFSGGDVVVDDFGVTSGDELEIILRNADSNGVTVNSVNVTGDGRFTEWTGEESISVSDTGSVSLANVTEGEGANSLDVTINYDSGGLRDLQVEGSISGNMEIIGDSTVSAGNGEEEESGEETVSSSGAPSFSTSTGDEDEWVPVAPDSGTDQGFDHFFDESDDSEYFSEEEEGFYVMKYEAKPYNNATESFDVSDGTTGSDDWASEDYVPRSVAANKPWRDISFNEDDPDNGYGAVQACEALDEETDEYDVHLTTNREWMTVARQVEQTDGNWVDGVAPEDGDDFSEYQLIRGWSDGDWEDGEPALYASTDDSDGFYRIDEWLNENDIEDHQERTFELANGEVVWDWSGNVRQWTYAEDSGGSTTNGVFDETDPDGQEYEKDPAVVDRSTDGVGSDSGFDNSDAALRGGYWYNGADAGVFLATSFTPDLSDYPGNSGPRRGFRCSAVPVS